MINGGAGIDLLTRDLGNDTFVFNAGEANGDTINDFAGNGGAAGDLLQFVSYSAGATFTNRRSHGPARLAPMATDWYRAANARGSETNQRQEPSTGRLRPILPAHAPFPRLAPTTPRP